MADSFSVDPGIQIPAIVLCPFAKALNRNHYDVGGKRPSVSADPHPKTFYLCVLRLMAFRLRTTLRRLSRR